MRKPRRHSRHSRGPFRIGDELETWVAGNESGYARIIDIRPYTGRYNFQVVLRVTAQRTLRGWMETVKHTRSASNAQDAE